METGKNVKELFMTDPARSLLQRLADKKITLAQLEEQCAYWLLSDACWNTLTPEPMPIKPREVMDYEDLTESEKKKNPMADEVRKFYNRQSAAFYNNYYRMEDLEGLLKTLAGNQEVIEKITEKLGEFRASVAKQGAMMGLPQYVAYHPLYQKARSISEAFKS